MSLENTRSKLANWLDPVLAYIEVVKAKRIRESDFDDLSRTMQVAWDNPHRWIYCKNFDDGIVKVICVPKISKQQTRYWTWGYYLTTGRIHWQGTKIPYVD